MTQIDWTDRLSEYLDGALTPAEQAACEAWLASSAEGRELLADLRSVVAKAKTLPDAPVPEQVWSGIATAIGGRTLGRSEEIISLADRRSERPSSVTRRPYKIWQLATAAVLLLGVGTVIGMQMREVASSQGEIGTMTPGQGDVINVNRPITPRADATYDRAIEDLQSLLQNNRDQLDTATVRVLEGSLARIDAALADAERALANDRQNAYLNDHVSRIKRQKLDVLRRGASLVQAS
jgi:tetratricopeptide (TPR) repeat protein